MEHASTDVGSVEINVSLEPLIPLHKDWSHALAGRYSFLMGGLAGQGLAASPSVQISMPRASALWRMAQTSRSGFHAHGHEPERAMERHGDAGAAGRWPRATLGRIETMASRHRGSWHGDRNLDDGTPRPAGSTPGRPKAYNAEVPVRGARYFVPKDVPLFTPPDASPEQVGRVPLSLIADGLPESIYTNLTFTKSGTVIVDQPNPWNLKWMSS